MDQDDLDREKIYIDAVINATFEALKLDIEADKAHLDLVEETLQACRDRIDGTYDELDRSMKIAYGNMLDRLVGLTAPKFDGTDLPPGVIYVDDQGALCRGDGWDEIARILWPPEPSIDVVVTIDGLLGRASSEAERELWNEFVCNADGLLHELHELVRDRFDEFRTERGLKNA